MPTEDDLPKLPSLLDQFALAAITVPWINQQPDAARIAYDKAEEAMAERARRMNGGAR